MSFSLDITTIADADVSAMDAYAEIIENSGLIVRGSLQAQGTVLSGLIGENAVLADIRTVLSDHVTGIRPVHAV